MGKNHQYVPFNEYKRLPAKYEKPVCSTHNNHVILVCETCDRLFCDRCTLKGLCVKKNDSKHDLTSVVKAERKLKRAYKAYIQELSEKHSKFSKQQKDIWNRFDDIIANYNKEEKLKAVDQLATMQVQKIQMEAKKKKEQIKKFPEFLDASVTNYSDELREKEEQLNQLHTSLSRQLREMHIVDVIRQHGNNKEQIKQARELELGACDDLKEMVVAPTGTFPDVQLGLRPLIPRKLVKAAESPVHSIDLVRLTDRGDVLYYHKGTVCLSDKQFKHTKASHSLANVVSLAQHGTWIFVATYKYNTQELNCFAYNYDLAEGKELLSTPSDYPSGHQMITRDDQLIIIVNSTYFYKLLTYDFTGNCVNEAPCVEKVSQIHRLSENHVFIKRGFGGPIKYDMEKQSDVWKSEKDYSCFTTDSAGVCFCYGGKERSYQTLDILLPESGGKALEEKLTTEAYDRSISEMDINNHMLAVRDSDGYVHLYCIHY